MTTATATPTATVPGIEIPGYVPGRWTIDPVHSDVSFSARHMMVSKVRGHFRDFTGELVTAEDPTQSSVNATVAVASIDTNNDMRDGHVKSPDFFDAAGYPEASYRSTGLHSENGDLVLDGELTLKGVTRPVPLTLEVNGFGPDAEGTTRAGFTARGTINRNDFGIGSGFVKNGVVVIGDTVELALEIEAILQKN